MEICSAKCEASCACPTHPHNHKRLIKRSQPVSAASSTATVNYKHLHMHTHIHIIDVCIYLRLILWWEWECGLYCLSSNTRTIFWSVNFFGSRSPILFLHLSLVLKCKSVKLPAKRVRRRSRVRCVKERRIRTAAVVFESGVSVGGCGGSGEGGESDG